MLEDHYAIPDLSRKVPAQMQQTEKEAAAADGDHGDRDMPIYDNVGQRSTEDTVEEQQTAASVCVASGTSVKALLGLLCFILLAAVVVMVTFLIEWRRLNRNQQEELWRSLGEMSGNLSQLSSSNHQLRTSCIHLAQKVELYQTEMEAITSKLNATMQNLTKKCPAGWRPFNTSCYLQSPTSQTWADSRKFCQDHGADLVVISDRHKQLFVMSFDVNVWIGVTADDTQSPGIWKGVNQQEVTRKFWSPGEPNHSQNSEICVELQHTSSVNNWNDANCSFMKFCVCEKMMEGCFLESKREED